MPARVNRKSDRASDLGGPGPLGPRVQRAAPCNAGGLPSGTIVRRTPDSCYPSQTFAGPPASTPAVHDPFG